MLDGRLQHTGAAAAKTAVQDEMLPCRVGGACGKKAQEPKPQWPTSHAPPPVVMSSSRGPDLGAGKFGWQPNHDAARAAPLTVRALWQGRRRPLELRRELLPPLSASPKLSLSTESSE
ncbi:hypothetical protein CDD83_4449 [Cordyceps sp. RAO-2017]|nr:hypothetical protein CDD83_4449 [Cordyceps sp. RAO-2017]